MRTPELLLDFLARARRASGARAASLLLHLEPPERHSLLLLHEQGEAALPEVADEAAAWQLVATRTPEAEASGHDVSLRRSADGAGILVRVGLRHILGRAEGRRREVNERRSRPSVVTAPPGDGALWLALRAPVADARQDHSGAHDGATSPDAAPAALPAWIDADFLLAARLAWSVYQLTGSLQDPVSQLPGRMEFQVFLRRALAAARHEAQAVSLLLVNPDDFGMINHRYGRDFGDRAVREVAEQLVASVRSTDAVFRYAGAVFAVVLPGANMEQCQAVADKLRGALTRFAYLGGAVRLGFSMGGVVVAAEDVAQAIDPTEVLRRADAALNMAKLGGGGRLILGGMDDGTQVIGRLDPLCGIFTADTEKDYRNMLLLWDTVGVVSTRPEPGAIASAFVERLALAFRPERAALFARADDGTLALQAADVNDPRSVDGRARAATLDLPDGCGALIERALASGQLERTREPRTAYALPLVTRDVAVGCLYLDGSAEQLALDSSDLIFLNALATQLAVALDRATLVDRWLRERESERRQLKGELRELRQALQQTKLVYASAAMHSVLETLRRVAASDATVLVIGESGTGKEVLAQRLHELSRRAARPFVTVDCGAIASTLLEAELFGHVKGAFTGADRASEGRIVQGDGGTVFLDEIGELPIELQAKLLRFVQEKELTPVGGTQRRRVDVRIVAATNRQLEREVAAGRFREDLYYRLQVISVSAPPLRERVDDILPLAHYFLEKFMAQHGAAASRLTVAAEQKLLRHHWPGNVRELQHCMLRAVLMCEGEQIGADDILLVPAAGTSGHAAPPLRLQADARAGADTITRAGPAAAPDAWADTDTDNDTDTDTDTEGDTGTDAGSAGNDPWQRLRAALAQQARRALQQHPQRPVPIGRWLNDDLLLAASAASDDVNRRAARLLGVPESTLRRQLDKARAELASGLALRSPNWEAIRPLIDDVVAAAVGAPPGDDLLARAHALALGVVRDEARQSGTVGAALMGVTVPTFRRWLEAGE